MKLSHALSSILFLCASVFSVVTHAQPFTDVAVGNQHVCALDENNLVDCSTQPFATRFDTPADLPEMTSITAGFQHSCGITLDGEAVCWGGTFRDNVPNIDLPLVEIEAGENHTCAIDTSGRATCWGINFNNQTQVPGDGFGEDGTGFTTLALSENTSCGIQPAGNVECWTNDFAMANTENLTGRFIDLDLINSSSGAGPLGCALRDTGDIQCWVNQIQVPIPTNGTYTQMVVSHAAICGLDQNQQLDCATRPNIDSADYQSDSQFISIISGTPSANREASNFCGVTVAGDIECFGVTTLPPPPGAATQNSDTDLIQLGLTGVLYSPNTIELFWTSIGSFRGTMVEVFRNDELLATTANAFSFIDRGVPRDEPTVTYTVRHVDQFGNAGPISNALVATPETLMTSGADDIISEGSVVNPSHTVGQISASVVGGQLLISWQGLPGGSGGLQGYEVRVNNEALVTTRSNVYMANQDTPTPNCNIISVAAISDDNTIIDFSTQGIRRIGQFGFGVC